VVAVNLWSLQHPEMSGIFNLGTGRAQPFNEVALATVNACRRLAGQAQLSLQQQLSQGLVTYIPFPQALVGKYQSFTQADLTNLRSAGCDVQFADVASGVSRYVDWLQKP
jgi:ADP-L-glycero-D-manno-heptose 6-epimerase